METELSLDQKVSSQDKIIKELKMRVENLEDLIKRVVDSMGPKRHSKIQEGIAALIYPPGPKDKMNERISANGPPLPGFFGHAHRALETMDEDVVDEDDPSPKKSKKRSSPGASPTGGGGGGGGAAPPAAEEADCSIVEIKESDLGLELVAGDGQLVVKAVKPHAPPDVRKHLRAGDAVRAVNGRAVASPFELALVRNLAEHGDRLRFRVARGGGGGGKGGGGGGGKGRGGGAEERRPPKRPCTAFIYFNQAVRGELMAECGGKGARQEEVNALLSRRWRALGAADRAGYQERADADKLRYEREKKEFELEKDNPSGSSNNSKSSSPSNMSPEELSKNAYKIFYDEMKSEVRAVWESATAAEVDKVLAGRWGQMTPAQRGRFEDLAKSKAAVVAADQARRAMAPPKPKPKGAPGSAGKAATKGKGGGGGAAAGAKGKGPKKPLNSFMFFVEERRPLLMQEQPDLPHKEVLTVLSHEWKAKSKGDKGRWEARSRDDQARYKKEVKLQNSGGGGGAGGKKGGGGAAPGSAGRKGGKGGAGGAGAKAAKDKNAPKKPKNAFMFFAQEHRPEISASNPNLGVTEVMKLISAKWKEIDRTKFEQLSLDDQKRYKTEMTAAKRRGGGKKKKKKGGDGAAAAAAAASGEEEEEGSSSRASSPALSAADEGERRSLGVLALRAAATGGGGGGGGAASSEEEEDEEGAGAGDDYSSRPPSRSSSSVGEEEEDAMEEA